MEVPDDPFIEARLVPEPPRQQPLLTLPIKIDRNGVLGPTRGQSRSKRWRSCGDGWVVPAHATLHEPTQRIVETALSLPHDGAVTGWASLHLAGAQYFDGTTTHRQPLPVWLLTPMYRADRTGVTHSRGALRPDEVVLRHGIPCTNIHRALCDAICASSELREAVVMIDMVLYAELTSLSRFGAYLARVPRRRGLVLAREAVSLADEGSQSPRETLMRLIWIIDALLPRPLCNQWIYTLGGRLLGRPDLLHPDAGVVGEYDGSNHEEGSRRRNDIGREVRMRNHGLEYFSFIKGELHDRTASVRRMHAAVARARASNLQQTWTLNLPHGGIVWSLDERLELRELQLSAQALGLLRRDTPTSPSAPRLSTAG